MRPFAYYAPSGTPIHMTDLVHCLTHVRGGSGALEELGQAITDAFGTKYCFFLSSGRAGMVLLLQALSSLSRFAGKNEVLVPSYDCYSVPASVARAGLRLRICDVNPSTLSYDLDQLRDTDFERVLAIVSANLYGLPDDLAEIEAIARENGVALIDDAAQSMGARIGMRHVGTFGSAGLYSLDKGKNITTMQGGILVTSDDEIADALRMRIARLPASPRSRAALDTGKLVLYAALLHPSRYWIPAGLPFLNLGTTVYTTEYPMTQYHPVLACVAARLFKRLDQINQMRIDNARYLMDRLGPQWDAALPVVRDNVHPVYLRLPLLAPDTAMRSRLLEELHAAGIGATASYPESLADLPEIRSLVSGPIQAMPGGRAIASRIITLPTHPYMSSEALDRTALIANRLS